MTAAPKATFCSVSVGGGLNWSDCGSHHQHFTNFCVPCPWNWELCSFGFLWSLVDSVLLFLDSEMLRSPHILRVRIYLIPKLAFCVLGGWNNTTFKVPSNPAHSLILSWFYGRRMTGVPVVGWFDCTVPFAISFYSVYILMFYSVYLYIS